MSNGNGKGLLNEMERRRQQAELAKAAGQGQVPLIQPAAQPRQFAIVVTGVCTDQAVLQMGISSQGVNFLEAKTILRLATDANLTPAQAPAPQSEDQLPTGGASQPAQ